MTGTNWSEGKRFFSFIIEHLPSISTYPGVEGLFNPNEIAGAMSWLMPLCLGLTMYYFQKNRRLLSLIAGAGAGLLLLALLFGQSFSALAGIVVGIAIILIPRNYRVAGTGLIVAGILVIQAVIFINPTLVVETAVRFSGRENINSLEHRQVMWTAARQAVIDHPVTGLGMAMFRSPAVWEDYPTPGYDRSKAVHAHNELLHIATDLGIPGFITMLSWYLGTFYMLYYAWKRSDSVTRWAVTGIAAGLIAHMIYGLADSIPLWDRFAFIFWWMLGLAAAQYTLARFRSEQSGETAQPDFDKNSDND
ncbi:MAG TPA: O-antigen ligase family protein [Phototrophicaceae bacterium]|nr:O-antigen ligase family protein [Phototrophicaceae bacterium]